MCECVEDWGWWCGALGWIVGLRSALLVWKGWKERKGWGGEGFIWGSIVAVVSDGCAAR